MNPIDKPTYDYLHGLIADATEEHDEDCSGDLLDCECDVQTNGGDLVDILYSELQRLRAGQPDGVCQGVCRPGDCNQCDKARDAE